MKIKVLSFLAIAVVITLSFTFGSVRRGNVKQTKTESDAQARRQQNEPAGGFVLEDKL